MDVNVNINGNGIMEMFSPLEEVIYWAQTLFL